MGQPRAAQGKRRKHRETRELRLSCQVVDIPGERLREFPDVRVPLTHATLNVGIRRYSGLQIPAARAIRLLRAGRTHLVVTLRLSLARAGGCTLA